MPRSRRGGEIPENFTSETQIPSDEAIASEDLAGPDEDMPQRWTSRTPRERSAKAPKESPLMLIAMNKGPTVQKKAVEMELAWLKDRTVLAERVQRLLRQHDVAFAVELVRTAQRRGYDTQGAWNAILAYSFAQKDANAAFRFWNDMKKRGSMPNSRAYTTMLHGFCSVDRTPFVNPMSMARSIYQSILDPDSDIEVNLFHHNAMLTACGHHGDMNLLWEIAGSLPEDGPGSPNDFTYTIILSALRRKIQKEAETLGAREYGAEKTYNMRLSLIAEGKKIWTDIVYRWKKGEFAMTNELVSAMAGLLWEGPGDWHMYEVLKLMNQTTGIPILTEEPSRDLEVSSRRSHAKQGTPRKPKKSEEDVPFVDRLGRHVRETARLEAAKDLEVANELETELEDEADFEHLFDNFLPDAKPYSQPPPSEPERFEASPRKFVFRRPAFQQPESQTPEPAGDEVRGPNYVPIGNRELSIIMETCLQMTNAAKAGKAYWNHLTEGDHDYVVTPDRRAYIGYLRILRIARQSRLAIKLIRDKLVPQGIESGLPFHLAMSICRRDRNNLNVFKNANELLKLMDEGLMLPDYRAISSYLYLLKSLQDNPQLLLSLNGLDPEKQSKSNLRQMGKELVLNLQTIAADHLRPLVTTLDKAMDASRAGKPDLSGRHGVDIETVRLQKVPGEEAVAVAARVRMLLVEILSPKREYPLPKKDRKRFEADEEFLRKYTKADVIESLQRRMIYPTAEQQDRYYRRFMPQNETIFDEDEALTVDDPPATKDK
ncbi:pentatricopeptide repeat-containing protein [Aspergillus mulundensis]|uniref:Pentatricopeptide repeat protein n=1 Tax=Aspergillus mulundensis TaxID=1810919 RepID=A0A3D8SWS8_9EURO|nr:hypothetical protein DSM5745_02540 [Aspergillus mulundensis]RDW90765.1 hypothetical protein DSM5745_02540 [Aspergillus mulundensis]